MKSPVIKVCIVEDDQGVRDGLAGLVGQEKGFECLSSYRTAEDALTELPKRKPDVILMDINLPGMSGIDCVSRIKSQLPATQVVMLPVYEDTDQIFKALASGASGYMLKSAPPEEILAAVRDVHAGGSPMSPHIARKVVQSFSAQAPSPKATEGLSPREQEVLELLSHGFLYKEIADKLHISFETVHTYVRRIYEKLHVRSRTEAVAKYLRT